MKTTYTIDRIGRCVLITGAMPAEDLMPLASLAGKGAVMDSDAARMFGVNFAIGPKNELEDLKKKQAPFAEASQKAQYPALSAAASKWLATGSRGMSSNAIFTHLTGVDACRGSNLTFFPLDPSDFARCQLLLEQVPELQVLFPKMATLSAKWAKLVELWPKILAAMEEEAPEWRKQKGEANKAYAIMQEAQK